MKREHSPEGNCEMDYGSETAHAKSKSLVIGLVVLGMVVLVAGAVVALVKMGGSSSADGRGAVVESDEVKLWCELRQQWGARVDAMSADIALKSVRSEDAEEKAKLVRERDAVCREFGKKVETLNLSNPAVIEVEKALIKEGKVRANIAVEIANTLAAVPERADSETTVVDVGKRIEHLRNAYESLQEKISRRIRGGEAKADQEVDAALGRLPGCSGIYRGPMTDLGTSGSPYVSWKELDLQRKRAVKLIQERIRLLEPREQYANHVYHELVSRHGDTLSKCYAKAMRQEPNMPRQIRLQIRLSKSGKVLGMLELEGRAEAFVECIVTPIASHGRLPAPASDNERVVLSMDLDAFR